MKPVAAVSVVLTMVVWLCTSTAHAFSLSIEDYPDAPPFFLAVAKDSEVFYAFGRRSPLTAIHTLPCTTGQGAGDKYREGDLKTPEGVYFIQRTLTRGLDWTLYGDLAFTLNYPNPVDRLKGKTGSGIWIHGRGQTIVPRDTQGCVALNNPDLHSIKASLTRGTPVVIARDIVVNDAPGDTSKTASEIVGLLEQWRQSWRARSNEYFGFYDQKRYVEPGAPTFRAFRENKERIFASKPWIEVATYDVQILPGTDYWVTWFDQYYRTDTFVSQVHKRLYWQRDKEGNWIIVGAEYDRPERDLEQLYLSEARDRVSGLVENWRQAWETGDIVAYSRHYAPSAVQDSRQGIEAIVVQKTTLWENNPPRRVELSGLSVDLHPAGLRVTFVQDYESASGFADRGVKTLLLEPTAAGWRIVSETWTKSSS